MVRPVLSLARPALVCAAASTLAACVSLAPEPREPAIVGAMPETFSAAQASPGQYRPEAWWRGFEDPVLDRLVDDALASNLDILEAAARLEQARAQARVARAALLPQVSGGGTATRTSTPIDGLPFGGLGGGTIDRIDNEVYNLDATASYELDLFGRVSDDYRAAARDAIALQADLRTVQLASAAETIAAYLDYVDTSRQLALSKRNAATLRDRAQRTDERFARGLVDSLELYQIRQDLRATEASLPQLRSALAATRSRLALLIGAYPQTLDERLAGPLQPRLVFEPVPTGLPIGLLAQRPDVAAGWARLEAARLRIGARRAERFPRLSFQAGLGTQAGNPGNAFDFVNNWTSSLVASLTAPIFDGGRISANIRAARAAYDQQAVAYARTVLSAFGEVESALADYEQQRQRYRLVIRQLAEAEGSLDLQRRRFEAGTGGYLAYLDASRNVTSAQIALSQAARGAAGARLAVHRALGGDWIGDAAGAIQPIEMRLAEPVRGKTGEELP
ncbi:MAG: TolC family protein [Erythrobacter sp.]|jgi:NodT family efflux transporter outer membrane factor (OMF) lipoprotein|nr:TolC family protein [Erythrobacter sp.]